VKCSQFVFKLGNKGFSLKKKRRLTSVLRALVKEWRDINLYEKSCIEDLKLYESFTLSKFCNVREQFDM
jgi:hypothetical protein